MSAPTDDAPGSAPAPPAAPRARTRAKFEFPSAVTTLAIVTVLVWIAAFLLPSGTYRLDEHGAPIPGSFHTVPSPLGFWDMVRQLILSPVNGLYGLQNSETGFVDTETVGRLFGAIGVVMFIMAIGAFLMVSFDTRALDVAVGGLAVKLQQRGWLLIAAVMALFSLLGSTMGFSVETFGFYGLFIPLMAALRYDRMVTAAMIIVGALTGVMAATVNPFSIGVAAGEANVSIGDGIALRVVMWVLLTAISIAFVVRYANKVQKDPSASLVGFDDPDGETATDQAAEDVETTGGPDAVATTLTGMQKKVLAVTIFAFALMIFSVIPWSSIIDAATGPAEDTYVHATTTQPYAWELNWWFPELTMLFVIASMIVGRIARMGEKKTVQLIGAGAADMIGPAMVVLLASGVSVIMNNTQTLDTILNAMDSLVSGTSASVFAIIVWLVNIPLAFLIPSSSGHGTLAMPLLAPLSDFAGVSRALTITAWILAHGFTLLWAPTSVVLVGGLAIARVGYDRYLKFAWPLLLTLAAVICVSLAIAAAFE